MRVTRPVFRHHACARGKWRGLAGQCAGRHHLAARASERALFQFKRKKAVAIDRPRHVQRAGCSRGKSESFIIGRIANEQDRAMTEAARALDAFPNQKASKSAALEARVDRQRTQQQGVAIARAHMPESHCADQFAICDDDERETACGRATLAQTFAGFPKPVWSERGVEQAFARRPVIGPLLADKRYGAVPRIADCLRGGEDLRCWQALKRRHRNLRCRRACMRFPGSAEAPRMATILCHASG